jgi:hypothetical protein
LAPQALKVQVALQVSKVPAPPVQAAPWARPVLSAHKVKPERQALKVRRWLARLDLLAVLDPPERKAQPEIRAHKAAARLARLAQPERRVRQARKVKSAPRVPKAPLV